MSLLVGALLTLAVVICLVLWGSSKEYDGPEEPWEDDWNWPEWEDYESE